MATGGPSAENAGADTSASNKDLTQSGSSAVTKSGGIDVGDFSSWNPMNNGGNAGLPSSVSRPL